ncbi:MAG: arginine--tRNA ligase, partial [Planctomycetes bacterium]|nr:arginine--tRNA ligase [Planctomycetota bacterium]
KPLYEKSQSVPFLVERYVAYNEKSKTDQALMDKARLEFKKLEGGDTENRKIWEYFKNNSIKEFDRIYNLLKINFHTSDNRYGGESEISPGDIAKTIDEMDKKGLTKISEGALIVDLKAYGMTPCLLRKSDGATLYAARDIAAAIRRYEDYKFHKLIYVVGADQKLHFRQIFKVLELMGHSWAKDCVHTDFGLVRFKGEKMSTRRGSTILLEEVLNETIERSKAAMQNRQSDVQDKVKPEDMDKVGQAVGIGAVIFNDLKNHRIKDVDFDWDQMLTFDGETGPYLMYTHTRLASIMRKYEQLNPKSDLPDGQAGIRNPKYELLNTPDEATLIKYLAGFPEIIQKSADEYEPSFLSNYLLEMASVFNRYYHHHRIITEDKPLTEARIRLCQCLKQVLWQGLTLLGITPLETM